MLRLRRNVGERIVVIPPRSAETTVTLVDVSKGWATVTIVTGGVVTERRTLVGGLIPISSTDACVLERTDPTKQRAWLLFGDSDSEIYREELYRHILEERREAKR